MRCRRLCVLCSASHSRVAATHRCGCSLFGRACFVGCASLAAPVRFAGRRAAADVAAVALRWSSGGGLRLIVRLFALSVRCVRALAVAARATLLLGQFGRCAADRVCLACAGAAWAPCLAGWSVARLVRRGAVSLVAARFACGAALLCSFRRGLPRRCKCALRCGRAVARTVCCFHSVRDVGLPTFR